MPTNLAIYETLLKEAQKIGKHKTKKNTVNEAIKEYIMKRKQKNILSLFGKVDIEPSYDYKKERRANERRLYQGSRVKKPSHEKGKQGSTIDALIASSAISYGCYLFTTDRDFEQIAQYSKLKLYKYR